jgi:hypothetical protein
MCTTGTIDWDERNSETNNRACLSTFHPHLHRTVRIIHDIPHSINSLSSSYDFVLCSFVSLIRCWMMGSRVGSVRVRLSIFWQACMTVV